MYKLELTVCNIYLNFVLQVTDGTNPKFRATVNLQNTGDLVNDTLFLRVITLYILPRLCKTRSMHTCIITYHPQFSRLGTYITKLVPLFCWD